MKKYLLRRILHGLVSIFLVVAIVMIMIYSWLDREVIFASDPQFSKMSNNQQVVYKYRNWQNYGYVDFLQYSDYLQMLANNGEIDEETRKAAFSIGRKPENDSEIVTEYIQKFEAYCKENGYKVQRLNAIVAGARKTLAPGGAQQLFAYRDRSLLQRLWTYFSGLVQIDNIHAVEDEEIGERKLTFTWYDPVYGGKKFSPAVMGNGTKHKYLLYCDSSFPFIHQNMLSLSLGKSYSVNKDKDVFTTMTRSQGGYVPSLITYPTGLVENSADDLHSATYVPGSLGSSEVNQERFTDNYTNVETVRKNKSRMGYSFTIGIIATLCAYLIAIPLGIWVSLRKDKLADKIGTFYIVFITAVPALCYILIFKAIGALSGLPTIFDMEKESTNKLMFVLPIVSLALPQIANLLRWLRRYMIDQMNSDYVKFARSGGLSEGEIFSKHVLKNAIIPIVQGIPASILAAMVGAFMTERVYTVPGMGGLLINAITAYDNGVIVGVTLFYATISVTSMILGDVMMSLVDPRINFTAKAR